MDAQDHRVPRVRLRRVPVRLGVDDVVVAEDVVVGVLVVLQVGPSQVPQVPRFHHTVGGHVLGVALYLLSVHLVVPAPVLGVIESIPHSVPPRNDRIAQDFAQLRVEDPT